MFKNNRRSVRRIKIFEEFIQSIYKKRPSKEIKKTVVVVPNWSVY
jgi:hypothetical protein